MKIVNDYLIFEMENPMWIFFVFCCGVYSCCLVLTLAFVILIALVICSPE